MWERERRPGGGLLSVLALTTATSLAAPLPAGADRPDPASPHLQRSVTADPTVAVDRSGRVYYTEPSFPLAVPGSASGPAARAAPYPLEQTFRLHSAPASARTIYLDFDGSVVADTAWNTPDFGLPADFYRGWSLDGRASFDATERAAIQGIWRRVAEDFAPFDVDVTTEDPGEEAIDRLGPADDRFGTRILVTSSRRALGFVCPQYCSGLAYYDVFDLPLLHGLYQPAWVFPRALRNDTKMVAETVSHEVGHTLGLAHDGIDGEGYYAGRGGWAPIMGAGFDRPLVQWSRGDYPGATNTEDDLAVIAANGAPLRADEAPDGVAGAGPPSPRSAYLTGDADRDTWALGVCEGAVVVRARVAPTSPDLDLSLTLLDAGGVALATADPPAERRSRDRATGLAATLGSKLAWAAYFVRVDGVGADSVGMRYGGYGSLGAYRLRVSGCLPPGGDRW